MFWKSRQFKEQEKHWYDVLADTGFVDIEKNENLIQNAENSYRQASRVERDSKLEYFTLLDQYIRENAPEFDDGIDYFVMHKFARGLKNSQICELLSKLGQSRHRMTLMYIRRKYENRWGIRQWNSQQLKPRVKKKL